MFRLPDWPKSLFHPFVFHYLLAEVFWGGGFLVCPTDFKFVQIVPVWADRPQVLSRLAIFAANFHSVCVLRRFPAWSAGFEVRAVGRSKYAVGDALLRGWGLTAWQTSHRWAFDPATWNNTNSVSVKVTGPHGPPSDIEESSGYLPIDTEDS